MFCRCRIAGLRCNISRNDTLNSISVRESLVRASGPAEVTIFLVLFLLPGARTLFAASGTNSSGAQMDFNLLQFPFALPFAL